MSLMGSTPIRFRQVSGRIFINSATGHFGHLAPSLFLVNGVECVRSRYLRKFSVNFCVV